MNRRTRLRFIVIGLLALGQPAVAASATNDGAFRLDQGVGYNPPSMALQAIVLQPKLAPANTRHSGPFGFGGRQTHLTPALPRLTAAEDPRFASGVVLLSVGGMSVFVNSVIAIVNGGKWSKPGLVSSRLLLVSVPVAAVGAVLLGQGLRSKKANPTTSAPGANGKPAPEPSPDPQCQRVSKRVVSLLSALGDQAALKEADIPRMIEGCMRTGNLAAQPQTVDCLMGVNSFQEARAMCDLDGLVKPWLE